MRSWEIMPILKPSSMADRKSTRLNSSHEWISYAVFCLKKKQVARPLSNELTVGPRYSNPAAVWLHHAASNHSHLRGIEQVQPPTRTKRTDLKNHGPAEK